MTGEQFHQYLKEAGCTQEEFANIMGVHRTTIVSKCASKQLETYWIFSLLGFLRAKRKGSNVENKLLKILGC